MLQASPGTVQNLGTTMYPTPARMYISDQIILTCERDCGCGAAHLSEAVLGDAGVVAEVGAEDGRDGEAVPLARHAHRRPPLAVRQLHRALVPVHLQVQNELEKRFGQQ